MDRDWKAQLSPSLRLPGLSAGANVSGKQTLYSRGNELRNSGAGADHRGEATDRRSWQGALSWVLSAGLPRGDGELAGSQTNTRHGGQEHLHQQGGLRVHQLEGGYGVQCGRGGDSSRLDPPQPDCRH